MREVKLSEDMTLMVYASIKELPIVKSKAFTKYLLIDAGIGGTMEDVDDHMGNLFHYLSHNKTAEALEEVKNMRYGLFQMIQGMDYKHLAMLSLVYSVNGVPVEDDSEAGLSRLRDQLSAYPVAAFEKVLDEVKKNLIPSAAHIFQDSLETILSTSNE
jgi:hypothetical protein